ncbi:MAG: 2-thiouracil desulfurase family protein, partial [Planctomycetota bacterium]
MILVSACLLGINCRFDGQSRTNEALLSSLNGAYYIPVCPEQLGGLPTPRSRAWITAGGGDDVLAR